MADVIIYGPPQSSYVRTTRMTCIEKGISYDLRSIELGSEAHLAKHPFGKVPYIEHGGRTIYETSAICRYLDAVFDGPSLVPIAAQDRAAMDTWISNINCYLYPDMIKNYVLQYIFPSGKDGGPNREVIDATVPNIKRDLAAIDKQLSGRTYLAGDTLSLADLFLAPILGYVNMFPEGKQALADFPNIQRTGEQIVERKSYIDSAPPPAPR